MNMHFSYLEGRTDLSCVFCGAAGLGIQTVEDLLARVIVNEGLYVFGSREYMSRVRGGSNSTEIRISSLPVDALVDRIDLLFALSAGVRENIRERITPDTMIFGDRDELKEEADELGGTFVNIPLQDIAKEVGGKIYSNSVAAGFLFGILGLGLDGAREFFEQRFADKKPEVVEKNMKAARTGFDQGEALVEKKGLLDGYTRLKEKESMILSGTDAVGLGALAGGCTFAAAYPMSPSTGVLTFLASHAEECGVAVEQVEDELAAINMAVGAAYAGGRSMVTTSGGGFALMTEGVSLAGVVESPVVIHLAQRPGPATGMATRTEQGDLLHALFSSHGEFPKAIYAPGTLESAFKITQKAFATAWSYHTPVIILTDQYFVNSFRNLSPETFEFLPELPEIEKTGPNYRRYEDTPDGVSPYGIPGWGEGIVGGDSHEHDEEGHVYEDFHLRTRMQDKRMRKLEGMKREALPPTLIGPEKYETLVICWGSTLPIVREALKNLGRADTALLAYEQVWPLHSSTEEYLRNASRTVMVEGNSTAQFARLIRCETGIALSGSVLKYSGLQFSVEEVEKRLTEFLSGKEGSR